MPLVATALRDDMLAATLNKDPAATAMSDLGTAIADYIKSNALVNFAWVATNPAPPNNPDPQTTATGEITVLVTVLTPSGATGQPAAIAALRGELIVGMTAALYNITESGFITVAAAMSSSPSLSALVIVVSGDDRDAAFLQLANDIVTWVKAQVPTAPCAGSHGVFVGAGTVTGIL